MKPRSDTPENVPAIRQHLKQEYRKFAQEHGLINGAARDCSLFVNMLCNERLRLPTIEPSKDVAARVRTELGTEATHVLRACREMVDDTIGRG